MNTGVLQQWVIDNNEPDENQSVTLNVLHMK